jgi:putative transposase
MATFFLSRLRKNTVTREVYDFKLNYRKNRLCCTIKLLRIGTTQNRAENYFRLLQMIDSKGNELQLITT